MTTSLLIEAVAKTLVHFIWQGAAIGLVVAILLALGSKRNKSDSSNYRYNVALFGLLLIVVAPIATLCMQLGLFTAQAGPQPILSAVNAGQLVPETRILQIPDQWLSIILLAWVVGVAWGSARLLISWLSLQLLQRTQLQSTPEWLLQELLQLKQKAGIDRKVKLLVSRVVRAPLTAGWLYPVLILPASALTGLSREQLRLVMLHELAHIRRYDYLINWVQNVASVLFFYHPVVHWIAHILSEERELCCDYSAIRSTDSPLDYAKTLLSLQQMRTPQLALGANGKGILLRRMQRLLSQEVDNVALTSQTGRPFACLITILVSGAVTFTGLFGTQTSHAAYQPVLQPVHMVHPLNEVPSWVDQQITKLDRISQQTSIRTTHLNELNAKRQVAVKTESFTAIDDGALTAPNTDLLNMPGLNDDLHNSMKAQMAEMQDQGDTLGSPANEAAATRLDIRPDAPAAAAIQTDLRKPGLHSGVRRPPEPVLKAMPVYPSNVVNRGSDFRVNLTYSIDNSGQPFNIMPLENRDVPQAFVRAAVDALQKWRFSPGSDQYSDVRILQQFDFISPYRNSGKCSTGSRLCKSVANEVIHVNSSKNT